MCGLTAFLRLGGDNTPRNSEDNAQALSKQIDDSLELVKHRGPDARGQWLSEDLRVGLGHVRLSIIDLSPAGNQPFHDSNNSIHAIVNGELYDHEKYREELSQEYAFKSHSDCEIVIALYKHYGISFVSKLRGEFALVLWDAERQLLFSARDRYGVKSLYYTVVDNRLLVATEMKSFLPYGWKPEWDVKSLAGLAWAYGHRTFFKDVYKVEPGQYLISKGFGPPEVKTYWDLEYPDKNVLYPETEEEVTEKVRELMLESVQIRLRADVGVGVYLSGGLDSSAIAGMVASLIEKGESLGNDSSRRVSEMSCFTIQFDKDSGFDESDIARRTAEWLGVDFHSVQMDEEAIASRLEDVVWHSETPVPNVNATGRMAVAEAAHAKGLKVILTGEGSDEHFSGYSDFMLNFLLEKDPSWPSAIFPESDVIDAMKDQAVQRLAAISHKFDPSFANNTPPSTARMLNHTTIASRMFHVMVLPFAAWARDVAQTPMDTLFTESLGGQTLDKIMNKWHPLNTASYVWTKIILANYILRYLGDNIDMIHQIETRPPFLDHHVTEYANNIPPSLKMKYDPVSKSVREKEILRDAMKPFVTEEIYNRTKHPFVGPCKFKEGGPIHKVLQRLLTEDNVKQLGFMDWEKTQDSLVRAFRDGDALEFQKSLGTAQFVVLGRRFGVGRAHPPHGSGCFLG
ncbi:asparagine synthetase B family protein [Aspergillus candidus]|uniref:Asparagine synthetase n=1 Tax=Aspergillus candidus TaxID=41067 RepID=A0A2I2FEI9_ASPCN|nr:asparagine synthetase [Aspergillus candidus]PLB39027.1 asparagine synthetase [Aspergillus candidus]